MKVEDNGFGDYDDDDDVDSNFMSHFQVCEGDKPYLNEKTLADHHDKCFVEAMEQFR